MGVAEITSNKAPEVRAVVPRERLEASPPNLLIVGQRLGRFNGLHLVMRGRFDHPERTRLPAWAHPVLANGRLYVRDQDLLLCYEVKAKGR